MPFTLVQAGTTLYSVNTDGGRTALTLPSGVTLSDQRVPRFARFNRYALLFNTPTVPLSIDSSGVVRVLTPKTPGGAPVLSAQNGGTLTGTYTARYTYRVLDASGNLISESDYSPISNSQAVTSQFLRADNVTTSSEDITERRLYRTTTLGATYFPWLSLDGNVNTSIVGDDPDSALGTVAAPSRGAAPDLTLGVEWKARVWGVDRKDIDNLRYTEANTMYAWATANSIPIPRIGQDSYGITALIPRRNALGIGRLKGLSQITGTLPANFAPIGLKEECGVMTQESVVVYNDSAYFLWRDGVYRWNDDGVVCVSDAGNVRSWFATDTFFNRAMFQRAFAVLDVDASSYILFLASAGSTKIDRWVSYDFSTGSWWGPHKTDAFNPSSAFLVRGSNAQPYNMVGCREGYLSLDTDTKSDWGILPIPVDAIGRDHNANEPDLEKVWGQMTMHGPKQAAGSLIITPSVGDVDNLAATAPLSYDMTKGRQHIQGNVGFGQIARLRFQHQTINQDVLVYGYELPFTIVGRR